MTRKIIIAIVSFLALAVIMVGIVFVLQKKEIEKKQAEQERQQEIEKLEVEKRKELQQRNIFSQEELEEIERLKNDPDLVWYEVPELGIRFKVTPDTKEDLGYSFREHKTRSSDGFIDENSIAIRTAMFYSKTETDEELTGCTLGEDVGWDCGWFQLSSEGGKDSYLHYEDCENIGGEKYYLNETNSLCSFGDPSSGSGHIDNFLYRKFFHINNKVDEKFNVYLNTIEQVN